MKTVRLQDICQIEIGRTPSRSVREYWDGHLPWATISDLGHGRRLTETKECITAKGAEESRSRMVPAGTLLLSFKLSLGKRAIAGRDLFTNEAIAALQIIDERTVARDYLYWALGAVDYDAHVDRAAKGKTLNKQKLRKLCVPLPPLAEQKRIAKILDAADALRAKRRESLALLDELLRSTFLDMFGDPVANPKGWPVVLADEVFEDLRYGTSSKCTQDSGPDLVPVLRIPNIVGGQITWDDLKYMRPSANELERLSLAPNDLLFVRSNGNPDYIGRCARYDTSDGDRGCMFASYLIRARLCATAGIQAEFLKHQVQFPSYRHEIRRDARTTAGNYNLSASAIRKFKFIVPPNRLQTRFLDLVQSAVANQALRLAHLAELDTLFASLQQRAFRGEL